MTIRLMYMLQSDTAGKLRTKSPHQHHPSNRRGRRRGAQVSDQEASTAENHKEVYSKWLREELLGGVGFKTIMVFPAGDITPFYRDVNRKLVAQELLNWETSGSNNPLQRPRETVTI